MLSSLKFASKLIKNPIINIHKRNIFVIINQAEEAYREFLGMNRIRLQPGIRLYIPLLHSIKVVDMRESTFEIPSIIAYTNDNVPVKVTGTLFYKVIDAEKACFNVQNYKTSVYAVGQSTIRAVIGKFGYDDINGDRNNINLELTKIIDKSIDIWGVACVKFEIQECKPQNENVLKQLELQMAAERSRRENELNTLAKIRTAEGDRDSNILRSEGELIAAKNKAEGDFIIQQKEADGNKYRVQQETTAIKEQLDELKEVFDGDIAKLANYLIDKQRLEHMNHIANGKNNNSYFFNQNDVLPSIKIMSDMFNKK